MGHSIHETGRRNMALKNIGKIAYWLILAGGVSMLGACSGAPAGNPAAKSAAQVDADPMEPWNRAVYQFNYAVDGVVLKPITQGYRAVVPAKGQEMVHNFVVNLYTPVVFANSVLQADPENSFASMWRFFINTSFGIGGLFDVATEAGLKNRDADFGQTLALYGCEPGAYLVLPIIGPSNLRDATGRLADAFLNPFNYVEGTSYAMWGITAVDQRSQNMKVIDDIYTTSLDPYSTFRSGYTQKRASDIRRAATAREKSQEKAGIR